MGRRAAWIRWLLLSEGLILLVAVAGPGTRHGLRRSDERGLIARWFYDDPSFAQEVGVNLAALHLFIAVVWLAAWIVTRSRSRARERTPRRTG